MDGDATRGWTSGRQAIGELWIVDVASGKTRRLREGDGLDPTWSPNGRFVAYWGMSTGAADPRRWRDIWVIPAAGGTPVAITHDAPVDWNPVWAPDGRWLYFASERGGSMNLWRVGIDPASGRRQGEPEPVTSSCSIRGISKHRRPATAGRWRPLEESRSLSRHAEAAGRQDRRRDRVVEFQAHVVVAGPRRHRPSS